MSSIDDIIHDDTVMYIIVDEKLQKSKAMAHIVLWFI
jgi:hypothetical protein